MLQVDNQVSLYGPTIGGEPPIAVGSFLLLTCNILDIHELLPYHLILLNRLRTLQRVKNNKPKLGENRGQQMRLIHQVTHFCIPASWYMKFKFVLWSDCQVFHVTGIWCLLGRAETVHFNLRRPMVSWTVYISECIKEKKEHFFQYSYHCRYLGVIGSNRKLKVFHILFGHCIFFYFIVYVLETCDVYVL